MPDSAGCPSSGVGSLRAGQHPTHAVVTSANRRVTWPRPFGQPARSPLSAVLPRRRRLRRLSPKIRMGRKTGIERLRSMPREPVQGHARSGRGFLANVFLPVTAAIEYKFAKVSLIKLRNHAIEIWNMFLGFWPPSQNTDSINCPLTLLGEPQSKTPCNKSSAPYCLSRNRRCEPAFRHTQKPILGRTRRPR